MKPRNAPKNANLSIPSPRLMGLLAAGAAQKNTRDFDTLLDQFLSCQGISEFSAIIGTKFSAANFPVRGKKLKMIISNSTASLPITSSVDQSVRQFFATAVEENGVANKIPKKAVA